MSGKFGVFRLRVVCVIPAFNEESTIGAVVEGAKKYCSMVLVVDDGSDDETRNRAKEAGGKVISHVSRLGVGAALSTGFSSALKRGAEIIVTLDGDGQHDPDEIPAVVAPLLEKKADIVVGSRLPARKAAMPLYKKIGNKVLSRFASLACGVVINDSQSGFRALSRGVAEAISHSSTDYRWATEMLILSSRKGFRIMEVPIRTVYFRKRIRGAGAKDALKILYNTLKPK